MDDLNNESKRRLENGKYVRLLDSALPSKNHPNYELWKGYALSGVDRGRDCIKHISLSKSVSGADVLDFGFGEGGHYVAFAEAGANVVAIDCDGDRIERARALAEDFGVSVDFRVESSFGETIPEKSFDIIICIDGIEHVDSFKRLAMSHARLLRDDGILFLTVPNRFSARSFLVGDPHYRMKGISLLGPRLAGLYVTKIRRR
jgi:2-polyprenyl-3-methyl-5-hydroxy-6-metoxy-1,4-benzoquinol methylase